MTLRFRPASPAPQQHACQLRRALMKQLLMLVAQSEVQNDSKQVRGKLVQQGS